MLPLELVFRCNSSDVQEVLNETGEAELSLDDVTVEMSGQEVFRDDLRLFPADFLENEVRDKNPAAFVQVLFLCAPFLCRKENVSPFLKLTPKL